jgi:dihydroxy-acid dehydratase
MSSSRAVEIPRYLDFPHLPDSATRDGKLALNKYSAIVTSGHDFPGAKVSLPTF